MRQFITWQFWASIAALLVLTGGLWLVFRDDGASADQTVVTAPVADGGYPVPENGRQIDIIDLVYAAQADTGFQIVDGRTTATMKINIDGLRTITIVAGSTRLGSPSQLWLGAPNSAPTRSNIPICGV